MAKFNRLTIIIVYFLLIVLLVVNLWYFKEVKDYCSNPLQRVENMGYTCFRYEEDNTLKMPDDLVNFTGLIKNKTGEK